MDPESFSLAGKVFLILNCTVSSRARFVSKASALSQTSLGTCNSTCVGVLGDIVQSYPCVTLLFTQGLLSLCVGKNY